MADAEECSAALAAIPSSSLVNYGIDPNTVAGSVASPNVGGNRTQPGRVMFRDQDGRDVRAYAHNEPMGEYEPLDVGKLLYAQLTGRFDMLEPNEIVAMGAGSGDGYLLTPQYGQRIIDLARSASVVMQAGAMTVNMLNQDLHLIRLLQDPTAQWRHPGNPVTATSMEFGMLVLTARTLAACIPVHIEWLEDARNAQQAIRNALMASMGLMLDQAGTLWPRSRCGAERHHQHARRECDHRRGHAHQLRRSRASRRRHPRRELSRPDQLVGLDQTSKGW